MTNLLLVIPNLLLLSARLMVDQRVPAKERLLVAGAIVYAIRRPNPFPTVFGFHEVFHLFVIAAVACQYASVAFYVLPDH